MFQVSSADPLTVEIAVWIQPGSSRSRVVGPHGDPPKLKIQIAAAAVEGAANEELIRFLRKRLNKARIDILRGHTSRSKLIQVQGLSIDEVVDLLGLSQDQK